MKTEQEQIVKMSNIITDCLCKNCKNCKYYNGHFCPDPMIGRAEAFINAGYGDVSEYKAEIERLKNANSGLVDNLVFYKDKSYKLERSVDKLKTEIEQEVKQAQIDTINTIVKYCENPNHWRELKDCKLWGGKSDDLRNFLNGIFKEIEQ